MPSLVVDPLDILEAQIAELEQKIVGNVQLTDKDEPLAQSLLNSTSSLNNCVASYDSISSVFDRITELGTYLDPVYEDSVSDTVMKAKLVLESEPELSAMLNQLNTLNSMSSCLTPDPYKEIPSLMDKLRKQSEEILKATSDFEQVEVRTRQLSEDFNTAMITFDKAHSLISSLLSQLEESRKTKQPDVDIE